MNALADLVTGRGLLSDSQMAVFWLCPHTAERASSRFFLFLGDANPTVPLPQPHLNVITSQRPSLLIPSHWVLASTYKSGEDTDMQPAAELTLAPFRCICPCGSSLL